MREEWERGAFVTLHLCINCFLDFIPELVSFMSYVYWRSLWGTFVTSLDFLKMFLIVEVVLFWERYMFNWLTPIETLLKIVMKVYNIKMRKDCERNLCNFIVKHCWLIFLFFLSQLTNFHVVCWRSLRGSINLHEGKDCWV